ncbi:MAG: helix-turn-helix domain-containing protein, partial [Clostridia bacterium]
HGESPASVQAVALHLELLLLDILKLDGLEKKADKTRSARDFSRVVEIMNQHIGENVSVPELARLANLSVSNMKKIFQKYAGTGVSKHFTRLKIIRAMQLLEGGLTVSEVSEQLGFSSQNYFSYVFRRETGRLPRTFKRL